MEIIEENQKFVVKQDGQELYFALTLEEALGYIDWRTRPDAGNTPQDCGCN